MSYVLKIVSEAAINMCSLDMIISHELIFIHITDVSYFQGNVSSIKTSAYKVILV